MSLLSVVMVPILGIRIKSMMNDGARQGYAVASRGHKGRAWTMICRYSEIIPVLVMSTACISLKNSKNAKDATWPAGEDHNLHW